MIVCQQYMNHIYNSMKSNYCAVYDSTLRRKIHIIVTMIASFRKLLVQKNERMTKNEFVVFRVRSDVFHVVYDLSK